LSALEGQFDLCLYNAGMDPCELSDQGMPGLKQSMLARRERMVFDWCASRAVPVAFVLAGGYLSPRLDRGGLVSLHCETITAAALLGVPLLRLQREQRE
jgi:acetoin utilization deacetylase AcuC-like enzyme